MTQNLKDQVAIVTGASTGIGAGIALQLGAAGAAVVVNYARSADAADQVVKSIVGLGGKAVAVQADVSKAADVDRLFAQAKQAFGSLDVLVNNAGVFEFQPLEAFDEEHYHRQFDLNVFALFLTSQKALSHFGPAGSIVNISSSIVVGPMPASSVYAASKGAVDAMTRALAKELGGRGIRVNAVSPGPTETERVKDLGFLESDMGKALVQQTPLGRFGRPDDIGAAVQFLASNEARWITGQIIQVSGGLFFG
jgi:3-oxoacyl-[acyl-carrier protein] reductase